MAGRIGIRQSALPVSFVRMVEDDLLIELVEVVHARLRK